MGKGGAMPPPINHKICREGNNTYPQIEKQTRCGMEYKLKEERYGKTKKI